MSNTVPYSRRNAAAATSTAEHDEDVSKALVPIETVEYPHTDLNASTADNTTTVVVVQRQRALYDDLVDGTKRIILSINAGERIIHVGQLVQERASDALILLMPHTFGSPSQLLKGRNYYKPFAYPVIFELWELHERMHWLPNEINLIDDVKDYKALTDTQRGFVDYHLKSFTQADVDVAGVYCEEYMPVLCKNPEVAMALSSIAAREAVHQAAYSNLSETVHLPPTTYQEHLHFKQMKDKHDYLVDRKKQLKLKDDLKKCVLWALLRLLIGCAFVYLTGLPVVLHAVVLALTAIWCVNWFETLILEYRLAGMAQFSGFTEGMLLFSSFAMLLNYRRHGLMNGMCNTVDWSVTDETVHVMIMTYIHNVFRDENAEKQDDCLMRFFGKKVCHAVIGPRGIRLDAANRNAMNIARDMVALEDSYISVSYERFGTNDVFMDLPRSHVCGFIRYLSDIRLKNMGYDTVYHIKENPLPWFEETLNAPTVTNFFENRATDYARPMAFDWTKVWGSAKGAERPTCFKEGLPAIRDFSDKEKMC
jgi:ribonucleoside-diphosphate reductase beta chain